MGARAWCRRPFCELDGQGAWVAAPQSEGIAEEPVKIGECSFGAARLLLCFDLRRCFGVITPEIE
jgi:hypothetical protein